MPALRARSRVLTGYFEHILNELMKEIGSELSFYIFQKAIQFLYVVVYYIDSDLFDIKQFVQQIMSKFQNAIEQD